MFWKRTTNDRQPSCPDGHRIYVVGDVHGMDSLLEELLGRIEADLAHSPVAKATLIFVGDLIDRGPGSAQVIERLRTYAYPGLRTIFLLGNHEEVLLRILGGDSSLIGKWLQFGGTECLASYGCDASVLSAMSDQQALGHIRSLVPSEHVAFIAGFADTCRIGDYLIVHAGIRPGVELDQQRQSDLRWIRDPFLADRTDHGVVVVHGHTIVDAVEDRGNRIAIDTGAYRNGVLSALVVEGADRRLIAAGAEPLDGPATE
jgi:serine/threonine protein phosphatase 1